MPRLWPRVRNGSRIAALIGSPGRNQARNIRWTGVILFLLTLGAGGANVLDIYSHTWSDAWTRLDNLGTLLEAQATRSVQLIDLRLLDVQARVAEQDIETAAELRTRFATPANRAFLAILTQTLPPGAISVFDNTGAPISHSHTDAIPETIDGWSIFQSLRDAPDARLVVGDPVRDASSGRQSMFVGRRLSASNGAFLGVVVATVDMGAMCDLYRTIAARQSISINLLRADGTVLVRYPVPSGPVRRIPTDAGWFSYVAAGGGTFRGHAYLSGRAALISIHPLKPYPLVVDIVQGEADILAQWRREAAGIGYAMIALAGAIIVLFIAISRTVKDQQDYNRTLARQAAALTASEQRLDRAQEIAGLGSWEHDIASGRSVWSSNLHRIWGTDPAKPLTSAPFEQSLVASDRPKWRLWDADLHAGRSRGTIDVRIVHPDGEVRTLALRAVPIRDADGVMRRLAGTAHDVTALRKLEAELAHAQKMEAIGTLAGGFAHDSNNMLGVIIGNLDLLQPLVEGDDAANELCGEALDAALRCANLIKRLLAFARRQPLNPVLSVVNTIVLDICPLLRRTLGPGIDLQLNLASEPWPVMVDPVQLQAAIVNLAANARDAMPAGGRLRITTANISIGAGSASEHRDVAPGDHTAITVRDTGCGIPPDVLERIFEPFFTTKSASTGTGLGLSMVFGFVKQSGGHISVFSEPGAGASFRIYLPRIAASRPATIASPILQSSASTVTQTA